VGGFVSHSHERRQRPVHRLKAWLARCGLVVVPITLWLVLDVIGADGRNRALK